MREQIFNKHFILSVVLAIFVLGITFLNLFFVVEERFFLFGFGGAYWIILFVFYLSVSWWLSENYPLPEYRRFPRIVNVVTLILLLAAFGLTHVFPDYKFQFQNQKYQKAVSMIQSGDLKAGERGDIVDLPQELSGISTRDKAWVRVDRSNTTVYFVIWDNGSDGSWGYLYRSDGNSPQMETDQCISWRQMVPSIPNWYYCSWSGAL